MSIVPLTFFDGRLGIQDVAVAYRTNLNKQNNIDFAKKAIQLPCRNIRRNLIGGVDNNHLPLYQMYKVSLL